LEIGCSPENITKHRMESVDLEYDYRKLIVTNVCQPDFFVHDFICTLFQTFGLTHTGADFKQKISTTIEQKEIQRLQLPDTKKMQDNLLETGRSFLSATEHSF
jgi:hypothetical protein